MNGFEISPAADSDIDELSEIERESFSRPWTAGQLLREIYGEDAFFAAAKSAERGAGILGFVVMRRIGEEAELMNIAVRSGARRRGAGSALLAAAIENARGNGIGQIYLEVRASNEAAIGLYGKRGFRSVGRRRNYYEEPREDAVIMKKTLDSGEAGEGAYADSLR
jgi:ribosomal-protein-alanine N-acetyltransferase